MEECVDPRLIWDRRYARTLASGLRPNADPWLERWLPQITEVHSAYVKNVPILELGCGSGQDTCFLVERGLHVITGDYAWNALRVACGAVESATFVQFDLRDGLPFPRETFPVIVAGLCLHYFDGAQTERIVAEVHDRLRPGGLLLVRVNSIRDANYGAVGNEEIEPGCYLVHGALKRFFDADDLRVLFADGWRVHHLEERTIYRYDNPKVIWEVVVEKTTA